MKGSEKIYFAVLPSAGELLWVPCVEISRGPSVQQSFWAVTEALLMEKRKNKAISHMVTSYCTKININD